MIERPAYTQISQRFAVADARALVLTGGPSVSGNALVLTGAQSATSKMLVFPRGRTRLIFSYNIANDAGTLLLGIGDGDNGIFLHANNGDYSIEKTENGADTSIAQSGWNVSSQDMSGSRVLIIDLPEFQVNSPVIFSTLIEGEVVEFHREQVNWTSTNLPLRAVTTGASNLELYSWSAHASEELIGDVGVIYSSGTWDQDDNEHDEALAIRFPSGVTGKGMRLKAICYGCESSMEGMVSVALDPTIPSPGAGNWTGGTFQNDPFGSSQGQVEARNNQHPDDSNGDRIWGRILTGNQDSYIDCKGPDNIICQSAYYTPVVSLQTRKTNGSSNETSNFSIEVEVFY